MKRQFQHLTISLTRLALLPVLLLVAQMAWGQCTNVTQFGTATAPTTATPTTITTCAYGGEYSTINSCVAGTTYQFNATGGAGNFITIRQGTPGGTVLGFGAPPISVTCTASGPLYLHYNVNAACLGDASCHTGTVACTSCVSAPDPCASITNISACATPTTVSLSGAGAWNVTACGFSTSGNEKVYSFTPTISGSYSLNVTSTNSVGYIDYFWKAASGGCSSTGWTCIDDVLSAPTTATIGTLTAGVQYYLLLDAESASASSTSQTFELTCPVTLANNDCSGAINLPCNTLVSGSTVGATQSIAAITCAGFTGTADDDVWYSFVATATTHSVQVIGVGGFDAVIDVRSGSCNGTNIGCADATFNGGTETAVVAGLTIGNTYYVRVYDWFNGTPGAFTIRLLDTAAPTMPACPATLTVAGNANCQAILPSFNLFATDNCSSGLITALQSPASGTTFTGAQTVTFTATDAAGNTGTRTCTNLVVITDNTPPTVGCPANTTVAANANCQGVLGSYTPSLSDNCSAPAAMTVVQSPAAGTLFSSSQSVTFTVTDAGNNTSTVTCVAMVSVVDNAAPTVTCPAQVSVNASANCQGVVGAYTPTMSDNCTTTASLMVTQSPAAGTVFSGTQTVTFTVSDAANNTSTRTCNAFVKAVDVTPPTAICPAPLTQGTNANTCTWTPTTATASPIVSDNCGVVSIVNDAPTTFSLGLTVVTYTVSDAAGNSATCVRQVFVFDNQAPDIICPPNMTVTSNTFDCSADVFYDFTVTDNCGIVFVDEVNGNFSGSLFPGGSTLVTLRAYDLEFWIAECSFWINVESGSEICDGIDNDCDGLVDEADDFVQSLKQADAASGQFDQYGNAVAIDGNTAIVGVKLDDTKGFNAGAAQILVRDDNGNWSNGKRLFADDAAADDQFGNSVAIKGDYALVGANLRDDNGINSGAVYVYKRNEGGANNWGQVGKLLADDAASNANFGASVAFGGRYAVVGANLDDQAAANAGAAYVFDEQGAWAQVAKLVAADGEADDQLGGSVATQNDFALVGASQEDEKGDNAGAAYLYRRDAGGVWNQIKKLTASNGAAGDLFGTSVDLSGVTALVGAPKSDLRKPNGGAAYVFDKNLAGIDSWSESAKLFAYDAEAGDQLGSAVAVDDKLIALSARYENGKGSGAGAIYTYFRNDDGGWIYQEKIQDPTGNLDDNLGTALDLSGRTIIAGAPRDDNGTTADQGSAQIFEDDCDVAKPADEVVINNPVLGNVQVQSANLRTFPVPVTDVLNVELTLATGADAVVTVSNVLGQVVAVIHNGWLEGTNTLQWRPAAGTATGTYYLRVDAGDVHEVRQVLFSEN